MKNKKIFKIAVISIGMIFALITLLSSFKTIRSGEVGLKVRFGKIVESKLNEGLNLKIPYIEQIVKVNIKVQKLVIDTESSSKDLQTIQTEIAVNYRIESEKAVTLYKEVGSNYAQTILDPSIKESIKATLSRFTAEEVITKRSEVSNDCLEALKEKLVKYGIVIEDLNIINLTFSEEYAKAIEDKQVAEQKLAKAKLEAEAMIVEAQATKKANDLMKQSLTKELLTKQFIEKWDGRLPSTYAGEDILSIFNLR